MTCFIKVVKAEMIKQHKKYFHSKTIYISLFLWPMLLFISTYYGYKPFNMNRIRSCIPYLNPDNVILFVMIGYVCMSFFRSLVQSAWVFSFERMEGTLELVYITPANRLAFVFGNAISSVFESVWLFIIFAAGVILIKGEFFNINIISSVVGILLVVILSLLWGMLLNSLFLYSRDTGFLFTILEEPMELFAGVRVPANIFPIWAKIISGIFPLTYTAEIMRRALLNSESIFELRKLIFISVACAILMLTITIICLISGEKHARETGNMSLF